MPNPFPLLKKVSAVLFLLALAGMICAGLLYGDLLELRARVQPETWAGYMEGDGPPQAGHIAMAVLVALSLAALAGMVYLFAAVSERVLSPGREAGLTERGGNDR